MKLSQVFTKELIIGQVSSTNKDDLFKELVHRLCSKKPDLNPSEILSDLQSRESQMTTGILPYVAIPHCHIDVVSQPVGVLALAKDGIDYSSLDGNPVKLIFMLVVNSKDSQTHLEILSKIANCLKNPTFVDALLSCKNDDQVFEIIDAE